MNINDNPTVNAILAAERITEGTHGRDNTSLFDPNLVAGHVGAGPDLAAHGQQRGLLVGRHIGATTALGGGRHGTKLSAGR